MKWADAEPSDDGGGGEHSDSVEFRNSPQLDPGRTIGGGGGGGGSVDVLTDPASGRAYRHNRDTGSTHWLPGSATQQQKPKHRRGSTTVPKGWDKHNDDEGRRYYTNRMSEASSWEAPEGSTGGSTGR